MSSPEKPRAISQKGRRMKYVLIAAFVLLVGACGTKPTPPDLAGIAVRKGDTDLQRWVSVFVWNQVRTGRYADLYKTYFGDSKAPSLAVDSVAY